MQFGIHSEVQRSPTFHYTGHSQLFAPPFGGWTAFHNRCELHSDLNSLTWAACHTCTSNAAVYPTQLANQLHPEHKLLSVILVWTQILLMMMMMMHKAAKRNHNNPANDADDIDESIPVPALTHAASSANAKGSGLENLTAVLMLQSSGGSEEEGRAAGCWSAAFCCS